jgi:hypothetical protein
MKVSFERLSGFKIHASDGEIGSVHDVFFHDDSWKIRYLVVDTGPWIFGRKVLVSPIAIRGLDLENKLVTVDLTKEQVKDSPDVSIDPPLSRDQEVEYHDYFHWPYYWGGGGVGTGSYVGVAPEGILVGDDNVVPDAHTLPPDKRDVFLRSAREVRGYTLYCGDDEAGEIDGLVIDSDEWLVPFLVVELGERRVLLPSTAIDGLGWPDREIRTQLDFGILSGRPAYDESLLADSAYLQRARDGFPERPAKYDPRHPETAEIDAKRIR